MKKKIITTFVLLSSVSCSQFQTGRSFLTAMTSDDSRFFNPRQDFPVVAGDTGRDWESSSERRSRTPASEAYAGEDQNLRTLKLELKNLEKRQSDEDADLYETHKRQLASVSEKIYYLKLSSSERREYLASRGFITEERSPVAPYSEKFGVRPTDLTSGMTKADVMSSLGKPSRVEIAGNPSNENERWLYKSHGASKYIYFESGLVEGWE